MRTKKRMRELARRAVRVADACNSMDREQAAIAWLRAAGWYIGLCSEQYREQDEAVRKACRDHADRTEACYDRLANGGV